MITAIIFDLEGVIIDSERKVWEQEATEFLRNHGHVYNRDEVKHLLMGKTLEEGIVILQQHHGFTGNVKVLAQERRDIATRLFKEEVTFIPGFQDFYKNISKKYKIAIATSLERPFLEAIDAYLHLTTLFNNHVYSIADIGYISKPNPDIFLYAAKQLRVEPKNCMVIEDSPHGVEAAKRAGMKCIALTTSVGRDKLTKADVIVDNYKEIKLNKFSS